jgi:hypothetical protein
VYRRLRLGFGQGFVEGLEVLAGFEADGFAGGDADLGAGSGIAADAGLAGLDGEDAKAAEFDAIAFDEALLHGVEDRVDGGFRFAANQTGAFNDSLNEILLDQGVASCSGWSEFEVRAGAVRECKLHKRRLVVRC